MAQKDTLPPLEWFFHPDYGSGIRAWCGTWIEYMDPSVVEECKEEGELELEVEPEGSEEDDEYDS